MAPGGLGARSCSRAHAGPASSRPVPAPAALLRGAHVQHEGSAPARPVPGRAGPRGPSELWAPIGGLRAASPCPGETRCCRRLARLTRWDGCILLGQPPRRVTCGFPGSCSYRRHVADICPGSGVAPEGTLQALHRWVSPPRRLVRHRRAGGDPGRAGAWHGASSGRGP